MKDIAENINFPNYLDLKDEIKIDSLLKDDNDLIKSNSSLILNEDNEVKEKKDIFKILKTESRNPNSPENFNKFDINFLKLKEENVNFSLSQNLGREIINVKLNELRENLVPLIPLNISNKNKVDIFNFYKEIENVKLKNDLDKNLFNLLIDNKHQKIENCQSKNSLNGNLPLDLKLFNVSKLNDKKQIFDCFKTNNNLFLKKESKIGNYLIKDIKNESNNLLKTEHKENPFIIQQTVKIQKFDTYKNNINNIILNDINSKIANKIIQSSQPLPKIVHSPNQEELNVKDKEEIEKVTGTKIIGNIGYGGFSIVKLGVNESNSKKFALKIVSFSKLLNLFKDKSQ